MIRRLIFLLLIPLFALPAFSQGAGTSDLDTAAKARLNKMRITYLSRLSGLEKKYTDAGNLDALLAVKAEAKAVSTGVPAPADVMAKSSAELVALRKSWAGAMQKYEAWRAEQKGNAAQKQVAALEAAVARLTRENKIPEAMAMKERLDALKAEMSLSTPSVVPVPGTDSSVSAPATPSGKETALSPEGLVVYITFEEESGVFQDRSPAKMPLVNRGVASVEDGVRGRAGRFNGASTYLRLTPPRAYRNMSDFTISAWIKMESRGANQQYIFSSIGALPTTRRNIIKPGTALLYDTKSGSKLHTYMHYASTPSARWRSLYNSERIEGKWCHVVSIRKDGVNSLYVNKQKLRLTSRTGSASSSNAALPVAPPWYVGDLTGGNRHYNESEQYNFKGLMDEFMFFIRAIGEDEIEVLYDRGNR